MVQTACLVPNASVSMEDISYHVPIQAATRAAMMAVYVLLRSNMAIFLTMLGWTTIIGATCNMSRGEVKQCRSILIFGRMNAEF
jgi:hypothetical protein